MTTAKNQTSAKPAASRSARPAPEVPADTPAQAAAAEERSGPGGEQRPAKTVSLTIPLDAAIVEAAAKAVTVPVAAARKVAQNKNGLPAYLAVGGLAVVGVVEWPVAAATGIGLAALRRWGPLKPAAQNGQASEGTDAA